jgi:hypothetical protein
VSMAPRVPTVYRFYDAAGVLLYVGSTWRPHMRWRQHQSKPWFPEVTDVRVEQFSDLEAMREAERQAIHREQPRHNVLGRRRSEDEERRKRERQESEQRKAEDSARVQEAMEPIRQVTADRKRIQEEWRQVICGALAAGYSAVEIARAAEITTQRVYQIRDNRR